MRGARTILLLASMSAGVLLANVPGPFPFVKVVEATVLDLHDIPETCYTGFLGWERTNAPHSNVASYCGGIYTDLGLFGVKESSRLPFAFMRREEIVYLLRKGCRYRFSVPIFGKMPDPEVRGTNGKLKKINWAEPVDGCIKK
jgi:hypothetical protein